MAALLAGAFYLISLQCTLIQWRMRLGESPQLITIRRYRLGDGIMLIIEREAAIVIFRRLT